MPHWFDVNLDRTQVFSLSVSVPWMTQHIWYVQTPPQAKQQRSGQVYTIFSQSNDLDLMQGHSGLAKESIQRWIISTSKKAISMLS